MAGGMSVADIISEDIVFEVSHIILQVSKTISSVIIIVLQYIYFIRNAVNLRILPCIIIPSFCFNVKITIITTNLNLSSCSAERNPAECIMVSIGSIDSLP